MRIFLVLMFGGCVCCAADFQFYNLSGHQWTNDGVVFAPGVVRVPMDAHSLALFSECSADGSQSLHVYFDDTNGETILAGEYDASHWWWLGFVFGLGVGGASFVYRMIKQIGRTSPEA